MFCELCGKKIEDNNKFCPYCGYKLEASPVDDFGSDSLTQRFSAEENPGSDNEYPSEDAGYLSFGGEAENGVVAQAEENPYRCYAVNEPQFQPEYIQPVKKKKGGKTAAILIIILILILGIGFGAFWVITDGELFESNMFSGEATADAEKEDDEDAEKLPATQGGNSAVATTAPATLSPNISGDGRVCYVNVTSVTLYKGPDTSAYKAICTASKDDALVVKGKHSDYPEWIYVYSSKTNDYGWVSSALVSEQVAAEMPTTDVNSNTEVMYYDVSSRYTVMINVGEGHNLNLRRQPDTSDPDNVILLIPDLSTAYVIGVSRSDPMWYYVEYSDGYFTYYGYIHSDHTVRYY